MVAQRVVSEWSHTASYLKFLFNGAGEEQGSLWPLNTVEPFVLAVVLALYGFLLLRGLYDSPGVRRRLFTRETLLLPSLVLGLWLAVPFAGVLVVSLLREPILTFRALVIVLPAAYLLIARAIVRLPFRPVVQNGLVVAGAGLLLAQLLFALDYYTEPHKDQAREVTRFLTHNERPQSLIAYANANGGTFPYYFERYGVDFRHKPRIKLYDERRDASLLRSKLESGDHRYVLYMRVRRIHPSTVFLQPLLESGDLELVKQRRFVRAEGYVFKVGEDIRQPPS